MQAGHVALTKEPLAILIALDGAPSLEEVARAGALEGKCLLTGLTATDAAALVVSFAPRPIAPQIDNVKHRIGSVPSIAYVPHGGVEELEAVTVGGFDMAVTYRASGRELLCRLKRLVARYRRLTNSSVTAIGGVVLDQQNHTLSLDGATVTLTPKECRLLTALFQDSGIVSRGDLAASMWPGRVESGRAIDNVILRLRRKLPRDIIQVIRGVGCRLNIEGVRGNRIVTMSS